MASAVGIFTGLPSVAFPLHYLDVGLPNESSNPQGRSSRLLDLSLRLKKSLVVPYHTLFTVALYRWKNGSSIDSSNSASVQSVRQRYHEVNHGFLQD
jgi:hypothetical protein